LINLIKDLVGITFNIKAKKPLLDGGFFVRVKGLEPPRREALDPKSSVSTNFTTPAWERSTNIVKFSKIIFQSKQKETMFCTFIML
tara:strand:- start:138 stop:395 length:258 start_codon:yes stop_codon:yes gene_type:complete